MEESAVETPADPQTQDPANAGDGEAIEKAEKVLGFSPTEFKSALSQIFE